MEVEQDRHALRLRILPGLSADEARAAYRRRAGLSLAVALVLAGLFWWGNWSSIKYDYRSLSFAHATGVVQPGDAAAGDTPLVIVYQDAQGAEYVDLQPSDGHFRVGQHVPIHYDAAGVCSGVDFGWPDEEQGIAELILILTLPLLSVPLLVWHGRRWRRKVQRAAQQPASPGWAVSAAATRWRRPLLALANDAQHPLYLPLLPRQMTTTIDPAELVVLGSPRAGDVVVLRHPTGRVLWPAGSLHHGRRTLDQYNLGRLASWIAPQALAYLAHLATSHATC